MINPIQSFIYFIHLGYFIFFLWILLHTKQENTTQKTSLVGERAHLVYKPHIGCPYNRCGTSPIPCNGHHSEPRWSRPRWSRLALSRPPLRVLALIPMLHTKKENTTQKTSLVGERAYLVYKPHIACPYNRCGTSLIPCNGSSP
ncbi:hypothetical protein Hanom_Chr16g01480381 [Helianthus anomalus]